MGIPAYLIGQAMLKSLLAFALCAFALSVSNAQAQGFSLFNNAFAQDLPSKASEAAGVETQRRAQASLDRVPGPLPVVHTEGTLPGKGIREISSKAREDLPVMLNAALAYRMTGDRRYLATAERFFEAWANVYKPSFNPIDETHFDQVMLAYDLTRPDLSPTARGKLDAFWRAIALGYLDVMDGKPKNAETNWQSHRVKLATMAAFQTGDAALIQRAAKAYDRQIAANIHADGSVFDFHERDALHYVTYGLDPLMMAALSAKAHGQDWFARKNPAGAGLPTALDWLAPYAKGDKVHQEFINSKIQFDADRAASGQKEYQPHPWDTANGAQTFGLARLLDPKYAPVFDNVVSRTGRAIPLWLTLYSATKNAGAN
ncbi:alginate lyase family protein [Caulobacter sp. DWR1-3-2b1]|uniref:alginate lyase family protein n=1 Tax=Caulobacter sp. DWR1-3-2b1 TaxID=2804670 RepID=UPI003CE86EA0